MRTIEFRGKMIDTGQWIFGDLLQNGSITHISNFDNGVNREHYEVNQYTVGQFTGLIDKNGKEIYDGDIVRDYIGNCIYVFKFGTISHTVKSKLTDQLNDVTFTGFYVDIPKIGTELLLWSSVKESEIEVIGNVHDNPELI